MVDSAVSGVRLMHDDTYVSLAQYPLGLREKYVWG